MAHKYYKVSAPGSLMLMGEHAVLHDKNALVAATAQRLNVKLTPNDSSLIRITDTRLGTITIPKTDIAVQAPFTHVLGAIELFEPPCGFVLEIESDFPSNLGFGSSGAVTVATVAVMSSWLGPKSHQEIFDLAQSLNQGGSGADIVASIYGGSLCYNMQDGVLAYNLSMPDLTAVYSGYKTPTAEVIAIINSHQQRKERLYKKVYAAMHECVDYALDAIHKQNWQELGEILTKHHHLQAALGTSNPLLDSIVQKLCEREEILGAKISGAGLGDCVIGLGVIHDKVLDGMQQFHVAIGKRGLVYEYN